MIPPILYIVRKLKFCYSVNLACSTTCTPSLGCLVSEINFFDYSLIHGCVDYQLNHKNLNNRIISDQTIKRLTHQSAFLHFLFQDLTKYQIRNRNIIILDNEVIRSQCSKWCITRCHHCNVRLSTWQDFAEIEASSGHFCIVECSFS